MRMPSIIILEADASAASAFADPNNTASPATPGTDTVDNSTDSPVSDASTLIPCFAFRGSALGDGPELDRRGQLDERNSAYTGCVVDIVDLEPMSPSQHLTTYFPPPPSPTPSTPVSVGTSSIEFALAVPPAAGGKHARGKPSSTVPADLDLDLACDYCGDVFDCSCDSFDSDSPSPCTPSAVCAFECAGFFVHLDSLDDDFIPDSTHASTRGVDYPYAHLDHHDIDLSPSTAQTTAAITTLALDPYPPCPACPPSVPSSPSTALAPLCSLSEVNRDLGESSYAPFGTPHRPHRHGPEHDAHRFGCYLHGAPANYSASPAHTPHLLPHTQTPSYTDAHYDSYSHAHTPYGHEHGHGHAYWPIDFAPSPSPLTGDPLELGGGERRRRESDYRDPRRRNSKTHKQARRRTWPPLPSRRVIDGEGGALPLVTSALAPLSGPVHRTAASSPAMSPRDIPNHLQFNFGDNDNNVRTDRRRLSLASLSSLRRSWSMGGSRATSNRNGGEGSNSGWSGHLHSRRSASVNPDTIDLGLPMHPVRAISPPPRPPHGTQTYPNQAWLHANSNRRPASTQVSRSTVAPAPSLSSATTTRPKHQRYSSYSTPTSMSASSPARSPTPGSGYDCGHGGRGRCSTCAVAMSPPRYPSFPLVPIEPWSGAATDAQSGVALGATNALRRPGRVSSPPPPPPPSTTTTTTTTRACQQQHMQHTSSWNASHGHGRGHGHGAVSQFGAQGAGAAHGVAHGVHSHSVHGSPLALQRHHSVGSYGSPVSPSHVLHVFDSGASQPTRTTTGALRASSPPLTHSTFSSYSNRSHRHSAHSALSARTQSRSPPPRPPSFRLSAPPTTAGSPAPPALSAITVVSANASASASASLARPTRTPTLNDDFGIVGASADNQTSLTALGSAPKSHTHLDANAAFSTRQATATPGAPLSPLLSSRVPTLEQTGCPIDDDFEPPHPFADPYTRRPHRPHPTTAQTSLATSTPAPALMNFDKGDFLDRDLGGGAGAGGSRQPSGSSDDASMGYGGVPASFDQRDAHAHAHAHHQQGYSGHAYHARQLHAQAAQGHQGHQQGHQAVADVGQAGAAALIPAMSQYPGHPPRSWPPELSGSTTADSYRNQRRVPSAGGVIDDTNTWPLASSHSPSQDQYSQHHNLNHNDNVSHNYYHRNQATPPTAGTGTTGTHNSTMTTRGYPTSAAIQGMQGGAQRARHTPSQEPDYTTTTIGRPGPGSSRPYNTPHGAHGPYGPHGPHAAQHTSNAAAYSGLGGGASLTPSSAQYDLSQIKADLSPTLAPSATITPAISPTHSRSSSPPPPRAPLPPPPHPPTAFPPQPPRGGPRRTPPPPSALTGTPLPPSPSPFYSNNPTPTHATPSGAPPAQSLPRQPSPRLTPTYSSNLGPLPQAPTPSPRDQSSFLPLPPSPHLTHSSHPTTPQGSPQLSTPPEEQDEEPIASLRHHYPAPPNPSSATKPSEDDESSDMFLPMMRTHKSSDASSIKGKKKRSPNYYATSQGSGGDFLGSLMAPPPERMKITTKGPPAPDGLPPLPPMPHHSPSSQHMSQYPPALYPMRSPSQSSSQSGSQSQMMQQQQTSSQGGVGMVGLPPRAAPAPPQQQPPQSPRSSSLRTDLPPHPMPLSPQSPGAPGSNTPNATTTSKRSSRYSQLTTASSLSSDSNSLSSQQQQRPTPSPLWSVGERPSVATVFEEESYGDDNALGFDVHGGNDTQWPPKDNASMRSASRAGQHPTSAPGSNDRRQYAPPPLALRTQRASTVSSNNSVKARKPKAHPFATTNRAPSPMLGGDRPELLAPPAGSPGGIQTSRSVPSLYESYKMSADVPAHAVTLAMAEDEHDDIECPVCCESLSFTFRLPGEKPHIVPDCGHALHEECFVTVYGRVPPEGSTKNIGVCGVCRQPMRVGHGGSDRAAGKNKFAAMMGQGASSPGNTSMSLDPDTDDPVDLQVSRPPTTDVGVKVVVPRVSIHSEFPIVRRNASHKATFTALVTIEVPRAGDRSQYPARARRDSLSGPQSPGLQQGMGQGMGPGMAQMPPSPGSSGSFRDSVLVTPHNSSSAYSSSTGANNPFSHLHADLRRRVHNYKGTGIEQMGQLKLFDILNVRRNSSRKDFQVYLFQEALVCISEDTRKHGFRNLFTQHRDHSNGHSAGDKNSILRVQGRISLCHVHYVNDASTPSEFVLSLQLADRGNLETLLLAFKDRSSHEMWKNTLIRLVQEATPANNDALLARAPLSQNPVKVRNVTSPPIPRPSSKGHTPSIISHPGSCSTPTDVTGDVCSPAVGCSSPCLGELAFNVPIGRVHTPVDLVIVVSTPAQAPNSHAALPLKLRLMRTALQFVLACMGPRDRIALVSTALGSNELGNGVVRKTPLLNATRHDSRRRLESFVDALGSAPFDGDEFEVDSSNTDERPDVITAVNVALDVVLQRKAKNPVSGMILISDTAELIKRTQMDLVNARLDAAKIPVHTFGYGKAHDPSPLWMMSNHTNGSYTFVKEWYHLRDALAGVVGGLMSVAITNMKLRLTFQDSSFRAWKVNNSTGLSGAGRDFDIDLHMMRHCERREILLDIDLDPESPPSPGMQRDASNDDPIGRLARHQSTMRRPSLRGGDMLSVESTLEDSLLDEVPVVEVNCSYHDPLAGRSVTRLTNPILMTMTVQPSSASPSTMPGDPRVMLRRMEVVTSEMLTRALLSASKKSYDRATVMLRETKRLIENVIDTMRAGFANPGAAGRTRREQVTMSVIERLTAIAHDIDQFNDGLDVNKEMFEMDGRNYIAQQAVILRTQRSWTTRTPTEMCYATPDVRFLIQASAEYGNRQ